jgi:hypothetical protein
MKIACSLILSLLCINVFAQNKSSAPYFGNEIVVTDSSSTIMIPVEHSVNPFSSTNNKLALFRNVHANIVFYDFAKDSVRKLFDKNTYIESLSNLSGYDFTIPSTKKNAIGKYLFYKVYNSDYDKNGRIDYTDPAILFISDNHGKHLKAITPQNENVVSIQVFEKQNFLLLKIQRDVDNDRDFKNSDDDYYYVKFDMRTLTLGRKIEL